MQSIATLQQKISQGIYDQQLLRLYLAESAIPKQRARYIRVLDAFASLYKEAAHEISFFSAPGRTEICGNHTDHNHGCVLTASVNLDAIAAAAKNDDNIVRVKSEGYQMDVANIQELDVLPEERTHSAALVRGVVAGFYRRGYKVGGFNAATASDVLSGSGLSSSAAFEVLLGTILNHLYNDGKVSAVEIAQIAQQAENEYFGKPSGLLDQMSSSVGNCVHVDFADPKTPKIQQVDFPLDKFGYALCIVDTGGSHAGLTHEYAAIRAEMEAVASKLGATVLREVPEEKFQQQIPQLRETLGDRAVLRALHFFAENARVAQAVSAIEREDFATFLEIVKTSGASSYQYNQNIYNSAKPTEQPVSLGLAISEQLLAGKGAWRVHGGGFAGTIQAFVPKDCLDTYRAKMEDIFGENACYVLSIRPDGGTKVF